MQTPPSEGLSAIETPENAVVAKVPDLVKVGSYETPYKLPKDRIPAFMWENILFDEGLEALLYHAF